MKFPVGQRVLAKSLNFLHRFGLTTSGRFPTPMDLFYTLERISKTLIFLCEEVFILFREMSVLFFPFFREFISGMFP